MSNTKCECDLSVSSISSEDNFGGYYDYNDQFSFSKYLNSTTQWWFGSSVIVPPPTI